MGNKTKSPPPSGDGKPVRLNKLLAQAGVASRRGADRMIAEGRVRVGGRVVSEPGTSVVPGEAPVEVDRKPVELVDERVYLVLHKPRGTICTASDPEGRERVFDLLPKRLPRLWAVGRLDYQTSGVLLLTNDGTLSEALAHPRHQVARVYQVKLRDELDPHQVMALTDGVVLDDGRAEPVRPTLLSGERRAWWYQLVLHEGRNREVRRLLEAVGVQLQKLRRVAFAGVTVEGVRPGKWRRLEPDEVRALYELAGLPSPPNPRLKTSTSRGKPAGTSRRGDSGAGSRSRRRAGRGGR